MSDGKRTAKYHRARAQRLLWLSKLVQNAEIARRYKDLADAYKRLADGDEDVAEQNDILLTQITARNDRENA